MADITQITTHENVMFSANSVQADLWMREHYHGHQICFELPDDAANAQAFRQAANTEGLTIGTM